MAFTEYREVVYPFSWAKTTRQERLDLLVRVPDKFLLSDLEVSEKISWMTYLYSRPRNPAIEELNSRNHVIGLYDPFAARKDFPAGRRWCVNTYVGCAFTCLYCYIAGYIPQPFKPRIKENFRKHLLKDIAEIKGLKLEPCPIHISNSTDPLQWLEEERKDTLFALSQIRDNQSLFSSVVVLTKNPLILTGEEYLSVIREIELFQVEISCTFYNEETKKEYEKNSPTVESRIKALEVLRKHGIKTALRIDPLFPREPLPNSIFERSRLEDYGCPPAHTSAELIELVRIAGENKCDRIIVSPLKVLGAGRYYNKKLRDAFEGLYKASNRGQKHFKGKAFRMSWEYYHHLAKIIKTEAEKYKIPVLFCKDNLFKTK